LPELRMQFKSEQKVANQSPSQQMHMVAKDISAVIS